MKLFFTDLDGTLLNEEGKVSQVRCEKKLTKRLIWVKIMLQNVIFADKNRTSSIFFGNLESGGRWKPHQGKEYETIYIGKVA